MKNYYLKNIIRLILLISTVILSCKRQDDFLDAKRNNSDVTPSTLKDFQAILDNSNVMNANYPVIGLLGTDNSFVTDANLNAATQVERNSYTWAKDIYQGQPSNDWTYAYKMVEYANIVLGGLGNIGGSDNNLDQYDQIKGAALFYRSIAYYYLAQLYCKPYSSSTALADLGIPIRLSSDINIPSTRASLQDTYNQIITDLKLAADLLPATPLYKTRPSQTAALGLLAKVYLTMEDYVNAGSYANKALALNSTLLDYNSTLINTASTYKFPTFTTGNPEVIFYSYATGYKTLWPNGIGNVDTLLYQSYATNDLRKVLYFNNKGSNKIYFYGNYSGTGYNFAGIANDEIYLIRAECYARQNNASAAMADLNTLLSDRWKTGTFKPYSAIDNQDALKQILIERRKELPFTGLIRWEDLRRLNKEPLYSTTITHNYNGQSYSILPNSIRYVYPIPDTEIQLYGVPQNNR